MAELSVARKSYGVSLDPILVSYVDGLLRGGDLSRSRLIEKLLREFRSAAEGVE
jgi:metal-responsive CopG/Arc/MetJ family transcriptional regulator